MEQFKTITTFRETSRDSSTHRLMDGIELSTNESVRAQIRMADDQARRDLDNIRRRIQVNTGLLGHSPDSLEIEINMDTYVYMLEREIVRGPLDNDSIMGVPLVDVISGPSQIRRVGSGSSSNNRELDEEPTLHIGSL